MTEKSPGDTIEIDADRYFVLELSEYLDVLGSEVRLRILKFIEKEPKDVRAIANEIETSIENTYKHLKLLSSIGAIKKEAGKGKGGIHAVWKYSVVPGYYKTLLWNIGKFNNVRLVQNDKDIQDRMAKTKEMISRELLGRFPALIIIDGADEGKVFIVQKDAVNIGRLDTETDGKGDIDNNDITVSDCYENVSRVTKPHARLLREGNDWYVEDCNSTNGTSVDNKALTKFNKIKLKDGNVIELGAGMKGIRFIYVSSPL